MLAKGAVQASGHREATGSSISSECWAQRGRGQLKDLPLMSEVFPWHLCSWCLSWSESEALAVASFTPTEARLRVLSRPGPHLGTGESLKVQNFLSSLPEMDLIGAWGWVSDVM